MIAFGTTQLFLLSLVTFVGAGTLALLVLVGPMLRLTQRWAPDDRYRALALAAFLPLMIGGAGLLSVSLPSLLSHVWPQLDHCLSHGRHTHLCFAHGPLYAGSHWLGSVVLAAIGAMLVLRAVQGCAALVRAHGAVRALLSSARYVVGRDCWVVPSSRPLCASVGLFSPKIVISEGLLAQLTETDLDVVVAHEREHARRRDSLARLLVRAATVFVAPSARARLLAALEASAEQACDEHAALKAGDRIAVAEAILRVERKVEMDARLLQNAFVLGFGGSAVADRVHALLEPSRAPGSFRLWMTLTLIGVALLLGGFEQVHHATESMLGRFGL